MTVGIVLQGLREEPGAVCKPAGDAAGRRRLRDCADRGRRGARCPGSGAPARPWRSERAGAVPPDTLVVSTCGTRPMCVVPHGVFMVPEPAMGHDLDDV